MEVDGIDLDALDYVVKVPYNGTGPSGGDSLTENLNIWYEVGYVEDRPLLPAPHGIYQAPRSDQRVFLVQSGDIAWMITATALVLLMIPGVG